MEDTIEQKTQPSMEDILKKLDEKCPEGKAKASEVWEYRQQVIAKYGFPSTEFKFNDPKRYIGIIEEMAKQNNIQIRPAHEFQKFFEENRGVQGWYSKNVFRDSTIVTTDLLVQDEEWYQLRAKANQLSHEIVHALQEERYPRMPTEEMEREAYYYQMLGEEFFRRYENNPNFVYFYIEKVEKDIQNSVSIDNKLEGKTEDSSVTQGSR